MLDFSINTNSNYILESLDECNGIITYDGLKRWVLRVKSVVCFSAAVKQSGWWCELQFPCVPIIFCVPPADTDLEVEQKRWMQQVLRENEW